MKNRRDVLATLAKGALAVPGLALINRMSASADSPSKYCVPCAKPYSGMSALYFPNVVVRTHENEKALFYKDLVKGKILMINFMSVSGDSIYPVTENLAKVQRLLGDHSGRDVFMLSITTNPEHDTPAVLKEFATKYGVRPGWHFLTGKPADIRTIKESIFAHRSHSNQGGHADHHGSSGVIEDCSVGLVRYGNEALQTWASCPAKGKPENIVKRLAWVGMPAEVASRKS